MKNGWQQEFIKKVFKKIFLYFFGWNKYKISLTGYHLKKEHHDPYVSVFLNIMEDKIEKIPEILQRWFIQGYEEFEFYYSGETNFGVLQKLDAQFDAAIRKSDEETAAKLVSQIFSPELLFDKDQIINRWLIKNVVKKDRSKKGKKGSFRYDQILLQLNSLYTIDTDYLDQSGDTNKKELADTLRKRDIKKIADYDHPVIFMDDRNHELINCLDHLNRDIGFEKEKKVVGKEYKVPVLVSISCTYSGCSDLIVNWVKKSLMGKEYKNLDIYLTDELLIDEIKDRILKQHYGKLDDISQFSVEGNYSKHFNALKYLQLLFEKHRDIKFGFKLDTDEYLDNPDYFAMTGKTWLENMMQSPVDCEGTDFLGRKVILGVVAGEYINIADIKNFGYTHAFYLSDVKLPKTLKTENLVFNKNYAHAYSTNLYNEMGKSFEFISHPVVKGGGYGISNKALRAFAPFTFSLVNRAEDQFFYSSALFRGCMSYFNTDARIVHDKKSVAHSEKRTEPIRFIQDIYRMLLFSYIIELHDIKQYLDPMPGIFASFMPNLQAFILLMTNIVIAKYNNETEKYKYFTEQGIPYLDNLRYAIKYGNLNSLYLEEGEQWQKIVKIFDQADAKTVNEIMDKMKIQS